jgi:MATE family multidrug resistance protein
LQWPIGQLSIWLVDAEPVLERLTLGYFNIRIYAAPATLSLYALNGWFLGMQNSRFALYTTAAVNLLNVGLSIALVEVAGMRTEGIALGTALAQWGGLGIGALLFFGRYIHLVRLRSWSATISAPELKAFFSVNADIFLRTVGLLTIFALFVGKSAELGTLTLASNRLLLELKTLAAFAIDGFAFAAESLTGRFAGARQRSRLFASLKLSFAWGGGLGLAFAAVFWLVPGWILGFFTEETSIIEKALDYLPWVVVYVAVSSAAFVWDGVFVGLTASRAMRNSMIVALFIGFLPAFYIAPLHLGNHGLWLAMLLSVVARGAAQTAMAPGLLPR